MVVIAGCRPEAPLQSSMNQLTMMATLLEADHPIVLVLLAEMDTLGRMPLAVMVIHLEEMDLPAEMATLVEMTQWAAMVHLREEMDLLHEETVSLEEMDLLQ